MSDESSIDAELGRLEAQLASLSPRPQLDRDQVLFAAGQRAGRRERRTANRLMLAGNLGLAAVLTMALATGWHRDLDLGAPIATPGAGRMIASSAPGPEMQGLSLAAAGPNANLRLLQAWRDEEGELARTEITPAHSEHAPDTAPSRRELDRLLRESLETL